MTVEQGPEVPRLTVAGGAPGPSHATAELRRTLVDGTAAITTGGIVAGGFGVEAGKSVVVSDPSGPWWFILGCLAGLLLVALGFRLRTRAARQVQVGIVVTAADARRGSARARRLDEQAENFSRSTCTVTLKTNVALPADGAHSRDLVDALADETLTATTIAERLTPDAARINLIPTMPLHIAFWFGARLGHTHSREIAVHSVNQSGGPAYFPATRLRAATPTVRPLIVDSVETLTGGDPSATALALDLQSRGDAFFDQVISTCRQHGIGHLLRVHNPAPELAEDTATFSGAVEQIVKTWREAALPPTARSGRHAIFLSGPVAIAMTLGARLAAADRGRWTAYTFNPDEHVYEDFPPSTSS